MTQSLNMESWISAAGKGNIQIDSSSSQAKPSP